MTFSSSLAKLKGADTVNSRVRAAAVNASFDAHSCAEEMTLCRAYTEASSPLADGREGYEES